MTDAQVRLPNVGKRVAKALTAAFVRTVKTPGKYFDGQGLILRVDPNGAKYWVQRIVIRGKRTELGLGPVDLIPLAEAREKAIENRRLARIGGDPLQAKREAQAALTFEQAAREVHRIYLPTWRNQKHAAQFVSSLETYAFPIMGKVKVSDVTPAHVLEVLTPIWNEKQETAKRVRQRIGTVMKWTIAKGWRVDNPAESIAHALPRQEKAVKARKALPYDGVAECIVKIRNTGASPLTKLAFELLVLSAVRSGEVRNAVWSEFDLDAKVWTIPAERMKQKKAHRVPLSDRAVEIVRNAAAFADGSDLVFPGARKGRPMSDMTMAKLIRENGYPVDVHGFRTSFRTWAQELTDTPREVAEFALAHVVGDSAERAYARSDLFEKRRVLMDQWAEFCRKGVLV